MERQVLVHVRLEGEGLLALGTLVLDGQVRVVGPHVVTQQRRPGERLRAVHTLEGVIFLRSVWQVCVGEIDERCEKVSAIVTD